uniref:Uncharacterized protein n=1 Tax=Arundo donax TaxID=35708 RepID=A0A0A9DWL3_ARUDO
MLHVTMKNYSNKASLWKLMRSHS